MPDDLISRSALIKTFEDAKLGEDSFVETVLAAGVYATIENAPTVDAVEVVHARWVHDDLGHTYCSKCHERLPYIHCYSEQPCSDYDEEWDEEIPETRYCPNCGAKMDGGEPHEENPYPV